MLRSYQFDRRDSFGSLNLPLYIPQAAVPLGLSILTLVLAFLVYRKLRAVLGHEDTAEARSGSQQEGGFY